MCVGKFWCDGKVGSLKKNFGSKLGHGYRCGCLEKFHWQDVMLNTQVRIASDDQCANGLLISYDSQWPFKR